VRLSRLRVNAYEEKIYTEENPICLYYGLFHLGFQLLPVSDIAGRPPLDDNAKPQSYAGND
jgi:hypothetical protein